MANNNLTSAKKNKNDEFYTRREDIMNEVTFYTPQLKGKTIYCNCDNPDSSEFYKLFKNSFKALKLKGLIATGYNPDGKGYCAMYDGETECRPELYGNGSFDSEDCIEYLKAADIVITNPPFSLFREYISTLEKYNKKYLIIGNKNAITYKEVFKLLKEEKLSLGYTNPEEFIQPEEDKKISMKGLTKWFTNLDVDIKYKQSRAKENYDISMSYVTYEGNEKNYPKYDNYNAINVDKSKDIPSDYFEEIGVPISFMDYLDPEVWEIVCLTNSGDESEDKKQVCTSEKFRHNPFINGVEKYKRIIIKRK